MEEKKKTPAKAQQTKNANAKKPVAPKTAAKKSASPKSKPAAKVDTKTVIKSKPKTSSKKTTITKKTASASAAKTANKTKEPQNIKILGYNDLQLNTYLFDDVPNAKAVVVVIHGMQEHCLRYRVFAEFLNKNGYIAVLNDLRGHGKTALSKEFLGYGEKDIFTETLQDLENIIEFVNEKYNLPIYIFGHSYGSLLSQNLIQRCPLIEKAVISGTANGSSSIMHLGSMAISLLSPFKRSYHAKSGIVEKMCIKNYGRKFERGNWLTKDESKFDEYLSDEYCGGSFPFSFYKSLIKNMVKTNKGIEKIGNKKILFTVGDKDPLSNGGKQVKKLYKLFLKKNINVELKIYHDDRHELLNETNRDEVMQDILAFYEE